MTTPRERRPAVLAAIAAGGAIGSIGRYGLAVALPRSAGEFPWATFLANATGAFALGVVATLLLERWPPTVYARPFLAVGLCGGYTTWSSFMTETALLTREGESSVAGAYLIATLACGLLATYGGIRLARPAGVSAPQPPARGRGARP